MSDNRIQLIAKLHQMQGGICFIGEEPLDLTKDKLEIDHIIPRAKGGKDDENNYAVTCEFHNRNKSDADLRVARCIARYEKIKDKYITNGPNRPNLGDFLNETGGGKYEVTAVVNADTFEYTLSEKGIAKHVTPLFHDKFSGMTSVFLELPIEYVFHDERINPRAVGSRLRGLVEEFLDRRPQLHSGLAWGVIKNGKIKVHVFDGQHKAVSQMLLGNQNILVRLFLNPDMKALLEANTNAGTSLRQIAFDKATQRFLGSQIFWEKVDEYRKATSRKEDDLNFSEHDLLGFFKGEHREIRRYIVDDLRVGVIHHPKNRLKAYVEFSGRAKEKPLSYSTIEKTFFSFFIHKEPLLTPMNLRLEVGENPRELEKQQLVELMNIIAEEMFENHYDFDLGTDKVEDKIRNKENIPDGHLRATRMSREEVAYNWLRYVHNLIKRYYLMRGEIIEDDELFEHKFPTELWGLIRKLIKNLGALPLWVNHSLSSPVFGGKQNYDFWKIIFETGKTQTGLQVLAKPLNLDDLIS
ncbi:MAG TPA: HNH endonuclease [Verrucomicrobia subdivision 3 bacterium]|nr:HNH endonuclease [Limisphaerales bacterium]